MNGEIVPDHQPAPVETEHLLGEAWARLLELTDPYSLHPTFINDKDEPDGWIS